MRPHFCALMKYAYAFTFFTAFTRIEAITQLRCQLYLRSPLEPNDFHFDSEDMTRYCPVTNPPSTFPRRTSLSLTVASLFDPPPSRPSCFLPNYPDRHLCLNVPGRPVSQRRILATQGWLREGIHCPMARTGSDQARVGRH